MRLITVFPDHNVESENSIGDVLVNSFMGRFIFREEAGDRLDFRVGLGMKLAMVEKNLDNKSYQKVMDFAMIFSWVFR